MGKRRRQTKPYTIEQRLAAFWAKVNKTESCWLWTGAARRRYGVIWIGNGCFEAAHRFSYKLHHGELADNENVLHHCDVTLCIRPEHIYKGTQSENVKDGWLRGRRT